MAAVAARDVGGARLVRGAELSGSGPEYKIVVLGAPYVGKTSLLARLVLGHFERHTMTTIGIDYARLDVVLSAETPPVRFTLWDTAGQEKYGPLAATYARAADAVLYVYALDDLERSLERVHALLASETGARLADAGTLAVLVGTKADLVAAGDAEALARARVLDFVRAHAGLARAYVCSALDGRNVELLAIELARTLSAGRPRAGRYALEALAESTTPAVVRLHRPSRENVGTDCCM
jgi:small GTP-binding protein